MFAAPTAERHNPANSTSATATAAAASALFFNTNIRYRMRMRAGLCPGGITAKKTGAAAPSRAPAGRSENRPERGEACGAGRKDRVFSAQAGRTSDREAARFSRAVAVGENGL